ncbi:MAG: OmpA family protein [Chitinispirillia bacterium]|jgi:outer membrane protein OmpA-like peptidoglycan-associated protein
MSHYSLIAGIITFLSLGFADIIYINLFLLPKVYNNSAWPAQDGKIIQDDTINAEDTGLSLTIAQPVDTPHSEIKETNSGMEKNVLILLYKTSDAHLTSGKEDSLLAYLYQFLPYNSVKATITGHADKMGDSLFNIKLSELRAKNVADFLVKNGFIEEKIAISWYGSTQPLVEGNTSKELATNRRTTIWID